MDTSASRRFKHNLTFSSTLLDEIYRSIDEQSTACSSETTRKKQSKFIANDSGKSFNRSFKYDDDERHACLYQKRMENNKSEKPVTGRSSTADLEHLEHLERSSMRCKRESFCRNSTSSSCDLGGFSSSESESLYGVSIKPKFTKPIPTGVYQHDEFKFSKREKQRTVNRHDDSQLGRKGKHEGNFSNTKSKALKIYNDLKKMKQPISPGGRLTAFINSIFNSNKKPNAITGDRTDPPAKNISKSKSAKSSTCSSSPSISRSCLSNTTSSRGKFSNGIKRSVSFYPVSVIVDEETDSNRNSRNKLTENSINNKNRHISEAARSLLKNYQKKVECEFDSMMNDDDENESNDEKSDSSSDLFELNSLSPIRIHQEELPLYATTKLS